MIAPNGSRWWAWGHNYEVAGQTERDGEEAVWLNRIDNGLRKPEKLRVPVMTRLLDRHGTRTDEGR